GTQRAARVRSLPMRPGVSEESPSHATRGASRSSGNLQRLQPGEFRQSQQYADQPFIRPIDADAGKQSGTRRRERRLQSSVPDWRTALSPAGAEVSVLNEKRKAVARWACFAGLLLAQCPCAFAVNPALDVRQFAHRAWTVRDGFFKGVIFSIAQTPDGYLWLGTEFGLLRFDGVRTVAWRPPSNQQLPSGSVTRLLAARRDGTLWIGTTKGLATWKGTSVTPYPEFSGQDVAVLLEDRDGVVWVGVYGVPAGKLCTVKNRRVQCNENAGIGAGVFSLYEDSHGRLWAGSTSALWRLKPGPPTQYPLPDQPNTINGLSEDDDGALLIGTSRGFRRLVHDGIEPYLPPGMDRQVSVLTMLRD